MVKSVKALLTVSGCLLLLAACNKSTTVSMYSKQLQGSWELRSRQAGMMPATVPPSGDGTRLVFEKGSYTRYEKNEQVATGTYVIVKDQSVKDAVGLVLPDETFAARIRFDGKEDPRVFFEISKDTLKTLQGYFPTDGGTAAMYVRIK